MSEPRNQMKPMTSLGGSAPQVMDINGVTLAEHTDCAIAYFAARRGQEAAAKMALEKFISAPPPDAGQFIEAAFGCFWTGPDQWMVTGSQATHEDLFDQLKRASGDVASVTEQNDAWSRFDLSGAGLAEVFERLCPVNLRAGSSNFATRTTIDHLGCFLIARAPDDISVYGPRSAADSLHHTLLTAIRSAL